MSILDITVVNVALPVFQTVFSDNANSPLPYSTVAWTVTGYTLALATVIPMTGWAADRYGTKRLYMTAIALFTAGSALCGPSAVRKGLESAGQAFAHTYWVAAVLMLLTLVPAWFLPRRAVRTAPVAQEEVAAAVVMH